MIRLVLLVCLTGVIGSSKCCLQISQKEIKLEVGETKVLEAILSETFVKSPRRTINYVTEHMGIIQVASSDITSNSVQINITALSAGKSELSIICGPILPSSINETEHLTLVQVYNYKIVEWISITFGWMYFIAWSACFYPQLYDNYKRKSVVGLNFDTVMFGFVGYIMYNLFNVSMVYVPLIKIQYSQRYPTGISPVLTNDLVFSMHGVAVTSATTYQCFTYYREKQTVSTTATIIVALCVLTVTTSIILALCDVILWLDVAYVCSYIKMYGNVMLYLPQVYMNYKRRSTTGFSIRGVIIDLLGGVFSMTQVFLDAYNYDDWKNILENPTKFGIGIITLGVSVVFLVQHYVLYPTYRKAPTQELKNFP